jgi:hypothetical protein
MIDMLASRFKPLAVLAGACAFGSPALAQTIVTPHARAFDEAATNKMPDGAGAHHR